MKIDIGKAILKYLNNRSSVSIPGVGSFSKQYREGGLILGEAKISAPGYRIDFDDKVQDNESFIRFLESKYEISVEKANKLTKKYSTWILNSLLNLGRVQLLGIGELIQNPGQGLEFKPESSGYNWENYGLPTLDITPIARLPIEKEAKLKSTVPAARATVESRSVQPITKQSFWSRWWPSLLLILFLSAIIFFLALWLNSCEGLGKAKTNEPVTAEGQLGVVTEPASDDQLTGFFNDKGEEQDSLKGGSSIQNKEESIDLPESNDTSRDLGNVEESNAESISDDELNENENPVKKDIDLDEEAVVNGELSPDHSPAEENLNNTNEDIADSDISESVNTTSLAAKISAHSNLKKYEAFLTEESLETGCVIVVGSFTKQKYVDQMRDKIMRAGLQPLTSAHNEFTRVGIVFNCEDHDLEGYIDTIRRDFDKYAWYLVPEMEVPRKIAIY